MVHWTPAGARGMDSAAVLDAVDRLALAWRSLGLERGERVAILSENRPEWLLTDYALLAAGGVPVPIYTSMAPQQIRYILADSAARGVVVSTPALLAKVLAVRDRLPQLREVVLMDGGQAEDPAVLPWKSLVAKGSDLKLRDPDAFSRIARAADPSDLATIIYTSGTTGDPKGVMLTHANFVSNVKACQEVFGFGPSDRALSFLPLSHVFERMADYLYMMVGVSIVHVSLEHVAEALQAIRPTILVSVPRLYEKMREKIEERVAAAPPLRRRLFHWARSVGREAYLAPLLGGPPPGAAARLRLAVADRLVLRKVRQGIGGRVRRAVSGGAALPRELLEYFITLGIPIIEGFGMTEASPVLTVNDPDAIRPGTVGRPLTGVELKVAPDGEILARGPGIMRGYFGNPAATAEALADGWLHTGDIGEIDASGCLRITDRKKDLIVTSTGKNVAPQILEQALLASGKISQAIVIGNGRKFLSALLVPDPRALEKIRRDAQVEAMNDGGLLAHPKVVEAFRAVVDEAMRPFANHEQVRRFALLHHEFTVESGEMTPTMKIRRKVVERNFRDLIESFYSANTEPR